MAESPFTGLTASLKLGANPSGVTVGYISGVTLELSKDIIEIIGFGMTYKEKVPAIKDWSASCDGTAAFAATFPQEQLYDAFLNDTLVTIGVYLSATVYFEGTAYMKNLSIDAAPDDKISLKMELAGTGAVVFNLTGTSYNLTFTCTDHATAGATQITSVSPSKGGSNSYMYRVNVGLPAVGTILTAPWTSYTLSSALPAINGDTIVLAEVVTATGVVEKRGAALAVVS